MKKFYELRDDYDIINKIKHEIVSNCIDDEDKVKLLTIIERVR